MPTLRSFAGARELSGADLRDAPVHWPRPSALDVSIQALEGVGPKLAEAAAEAGIQTVGDVLLRFPHSHRDRQIQPLGQPAAGRRRGRSWSRSSAPSRAPSANAV